MRIAVLAVAACLSLFAPEGYAMTIDDIPSQPAEDAVMASPAEVARMTQWAMEAFVGEAPTDAQPPVRLELVRQDHNTLHFGQSCMDTELRIGDRVFQHGLGTHANSEITVHVPAGAVRFEAFAGIDNNYDTGGVRGSAVFSVEASGRELARTPVLRGGDAPFAVGFDLPDGAATISLKVDTTDDGPSHDQSDWADAAFVMGNGQRVWLDEGRTTPFLGRPVAPFSFRYDGRPSAEFIDAWARTVTTKEHDSYRSLTATWDAPDKAVRVTADVKIYKHYPAVDWVIYFENTGDSDTPVIEEIQALDFTLDIPVPKAPVTVGHNRGDHCGETSFENVETPLAAGGTFSLAPNGGRSSNGAFPFFDLRYGGQTLITAIGWSGQWALDVTRQPEGATRMLAGMQRTHLALHPGERIRTPRILMAANTSDAVTAHNRFRRLMLFEYAPRSQGKPVALPVALQCFDRYSWTVPEWATEAGQVDAIENAAALGFDSHWFDAAWFVGGFPNGVGNWYPKPEAFPRGLKPVGDACHDKGLRFILWYEPERVAVGSQIANEHPQYVFGGKEGGLFRLDDPEARRWLTELLSSQIAEYGIDVYRNDFNIDPLGFWQRNDAENRQGMTEIRYVEGLYAMWDELIERHPGLVIDNCASGGRRIDLEMCTRSVPLWRSDTNCSPGNAEWNPGHSAGIGYYIPLHTACAWAPSAYEVRAAVTGGLICQWPYRDKDFPVDEAKRVLAEAKEIQKYWYGDLYNLVTGPVTDSRWWVVQMHRADLDEGVAMFYRRAGSPYTAVQVALQAIDPEAEYTVERCTDQGETITEQIQGARLSEAFEGRLPDPASCLVVRYRRVPK